MGRSFCCLVFAALLGACEPSTAGTNIATTQPTTYASLRVFDFMADLPDPDAFVSDTFISIPSELPVAFAPLTAPAITDFQQVPVGTWTAYLSQSGTSLAASAVQLPKKGQFITLIETGVTGDGGSPTPSLAWDVEAYPTLMAGQAGVRFVLGAPSGAGLMVSLTGPSAPDVLTSNAMIGQPTDWMQVEPTATALVLDDGITPPTFPIAPPAAGSLHTYAIVLLPSTGDLAALDITESTTGSGTASTPIAPSSNP